MCKMSVYNVDACTHACTHTNRRRKCRGRGPVAAGKLLNLLQKRSSWPCAGEHACTTRIYPHSHSRCSTPHLSTYAHAQFRVIDDICSLHARTGTRRLSGRWMRVSAQSSSKVYVIRYCAFFFCHYTRHSHWREIHLLRTHTVCLCQCHQSPSKARSFTCLGHTRTCLLNPNSRHRGAVCECGRLSVVNEQASGRAGAS